jgi:uncharacterized protein (DUF1800 family)
MLALTLCLILPGNLVGAQEATAISPSQPEAPHKTALPARPTYATLDPEQRNLHVLSRFTFGPTPEDEKSIRTLGIDRWFDQQLHPASLPQTPSDFQLNTRLAEYPALQLPVNQLLENFPSGQTIRQTINGKHPMPQNPYLAAVYIRHIRILKDKEAEKAQERKQEAQNQPAKPGQPGMTPVLGQPNAMQPEAMPVSTTQPQPAASAAPPAAPDPQRPTYVDLLVKSVLALPPADRINRIMAMQKTEYDQFRSGIRGHLRLQLTDDMSPAQRELLLDYDNPTRTVVEELQAQRLLRDIYSSHQLQEVMTTFWLNHFNIYLRKNEVEPYYLVSYERDVIRPRALGNFEDLLVATAESPAMMIYLDNASSTGPNSPTSFKQRQRAAMGRGGKAAPPGLNENYGRELMELHTLGVNGGYTQQDVTEVAKVFTGWTVDKPGQGGGFIFDEARHEPGKKLVLGHKIKENGMKEGLQMLHILATSPATAHFISQELAVAFVSDTPPPALVNRMAQTFLSKNGDIPSVLKTMLHSPEFWSPATYQAKVKTPLEYVVSAVRASGTDIANPQPLANALNQMGMPLYACIPPTGYSAKADEWVSTGALVTRMNFGLTLATNRYPDIRANWSNMIPGAADQSVASTPLITPAEAEKAFEARLIPMGISDQTRTAVLSQSQDPVKMQELVKPLPVVDGEINTAKLEPQNVAALKAATASANALERQNAQLAGLLLGSPEFQRR